jgi:hypothetical protein
MILISALVDDEETQAAIKQVLSKYARTAVGVVRFKKREKRGKPDSERPEMADTETEEESEEEEGSVARPARPVK